MSGKTKVEILVAPGCASREVTVQVGKKLAIEYSGRCNRQEWGSFDGSGN